MLKEIVEHGYASFHKHFDHWEDAIIASYQPLVEDGIVNMEYIQNVIDCVTTYGPYIVIIPGIAMPHSTQGSEGCFGTAISFMKVEDDVDFDKNDPDKKARLFFSLASMDPEEHLKNIQELMNCLMSEEIMEALMQVHTMRDLHNVVNLEMRLHE